MKKYVKRMKKEIEKLDKKIEKLVMFVGTEKYRQLSGGDQFLLGKQLYHMRGYSDALYKRYTEACND